MPRHQRFSSAGYVFHVVNRGAGRQSLFDDEADYDQFVALLEQARQRVAMQMLAYCLMPNHFHLLLWPTTDDSLSDYLHWLTTTHSQRRHAKLKTTGTGPIYQGRFKSFPVQDDDHFLTVARYVERNALRANLVQRAEHWKWSSLWQVHHQRSDIPLAVWPVARGSEWLKFVNEPQTDSELSTIRHSVRTGRPYGTSEWCRTTAQTLGLESTLRTRGNPGRF
ncbi:transposase [Anatilimnocola sp. NA78]|uniref:transposase n=1 Tax=Anatilimnocola sp. NA78 TaxID=3415683 RepID=UPI003CE4A75C